MSVLATVFVILVGLCMSCSAALGAETASTHPRSGDVSGLFRSAEDRWREGKHAEARDVYAAIAKHPTASRREVVRALRMVVQISRGVLGDAQTARSSAEQLLRITEQADADALIRLSRAQALLTLADLEKERRDFEASIRLWARLLEESPDYPDKLVIHMAYMEIARGHHALGRHREAVAAYDQCVAKCPEIRQSPDRYLELLHERIIAHGLQWSSDEHSRLLRDLWTQEAFRGRARWFNIGRELASSLHSARKYPDVVEIANELRASAREVAKDDLSRADQAVLETAHSECLFRLASALAFLGDIQGAVNTYAELVRLFPQSPAARAAEPELAMLREKLAKEAGGPHRDP